MNNVCIEGKITKDATKVLVNNEGTETFLVTFTMLDTGLPYQKSSPMFIEVHFMNDVGTRLLPDLVKGKEVLVDGFLTRKDYTTRSGVDKSKLYISASIVEFTGSSAKAEGGEYGRNNNDGCY